MNKQRILKIWNLLLALALICALTAIALAKLTHSGAFFEIHETCGLIFAALAVGHVVLNWGWIRNAMKGKK
jgi:hypothetical protein